MVYCLNLKSGKNTLFMKKEYVLHEFYSTDTQISIYNIEICVFFSFF